MQLNSVTQGPYSKNIGSRTYLMSDDYAYELFHLKNKEFTFMVDDSNFDCGLDGALYFAQSMAMLALNPALGTATLSAHMT